MKWIPVLLFAGALLLGVLVVCFFPHERQAGSLKPQDSLYQFKFTMITHGTNHVVYNGSLAVAKRALSRSPLRSLIRLFPRTLPATYWAEKSSPTNAMVFWVVWTTTNYTYKLIQGIPHPDHLGCGAFSCFLCEPTGRSRELLQFAASEAPFIKEMAEAWIMPSDVTNLNGCDIRLTLGPRGREIGTMALRE